MKTFLKLQRKMSEGTPTANFVTVVRQIERVLGPDRPMTVEADETRDSFAVKYLRYNLSRKINNATKEDAANRKVRTIDGLLKQEAINKLFNQSATFGYNPITGSYESDLLGDQLLLRAKDIVSDILGTLKLEEVLKRCSFGSGASATLVRAVAQAPHKFKYGLSTTRGLHRFSEILIADCPAWHTLLNPTGIKYCGSSSGISPVSPSTAKVVVGSVLDVVPKDATIDRVIMKEPELNGFVQKGIGSLIRDKLRRYNSFIPDGMNLSTSGDLNSDLARVGSIHGRIATVDAERASDSITLALCEFLLPDEWYRLLLAARSPYVLIDGKCHRLEMMSGMGNGFTFELESMFFFAIGLACSERSQQPFAHLMVSVHGDDLTVPSDVADEVRAAYQAAGLVINKAKSFFSGPFRESCGGHWFEGHSVKPFFIKKSDGSTRGDWFWLSNSLLLWLCDRNTVDFVNNGKYADLVAIHAAIMDYATDGNPSAWSVPSAYSRRAGLFGNPVRTKGPTWHTRMVRDNPASIKIEQECAYVNWLNRPVISATVLELLAHKAGESDPYTATDEVIEVESWVRVNLWPVINIVPRVSSLWRSLVHHKLIS